MQRSRLTRAWDLRSYDRPFKLFLLVSSASMVLQTTIVTLTVELAAALPFITASRQIGDLAAAGNVTMALSSLLWAMLGRRLSPSRLLLLGQLLATSGFVAMVYAPTYNALAVSLLLCYLGAGAMVALGPVLAMALAPRSASGQALSVSAIASMFGATMGTVVPSFMVANVPWPIPMLVPAAYSLVGILAASLLRLPVRNASQAQPLSLRQELTGWGQMLRVRSNITLLLFFAVLQFALGGAGYYLFTVLKEEYALSASEAMGVVMASQALILVATGFWGSAADDAVKKRPDGRVRTLLLSTLVATVCQIASYAVLPLFRLNPWYLGLYLLFSLFSSAAGGRSVTPVVYSIIGDTTPADLCSLAVSLRNLIGIAASGLGIALTGALRGAVGSYTSAMLLSSAIGPLAVLLLLPALRQVPHDMAARAAECDQAAQETGPATP